MRAVLLALAIVCLSAPAAGFCRTTTCVPWLSCEEAPEDCCVSDEHGCDVNGRPVAWPTGCVSYRVDGAGTELRAISAEVLQQQVDSALYDWLSTECDGGSLPLSADFTGFSDCSEPGFDSSNEGFNDNLWHFNDDAERIDEDLELDISVYALTTSTIHRKSGTIYDMDVELNSAIAEFTTDESEVGIDLASIVMHEAGHFLGLEHSLHPESTMSHEYEGGSLAPRTLSQDDRAGVCAMYGEDASPPEVVSCSTRGAGERACSSSAPSASPSPARASNEPPLGCTMTSPRRSAPTALLLGLWFLGVGVGARRWRESDGDAKVDE